MSCDKGIFSYTLVIYYNENTEVVKGLYTNREKIDFEDTKS